MREFEKNIIELLHSQYDIYKNIEISLKKVLDHQHGSAWGVEKVGEMDIHFNKLKKIDKKINEILTAQSALKDNVEISKIAVDLKTITVNVNHLLGLFQARLKGGREHVLSKIKDVLKGMEIKGYQKQYNRKTKLRADMC